MHLLGRVAEYNMLVLRRYIQLLCQCGQALGGLLLQLVLHIGKIYRNIATVSEGQWLENMAQRDLCVAPVKKQLDAIYHLL